MEIGNAVPPVLMWHVTRALRDTIQAKLPPIKVRVPVRQLELFEMSEEYPKNIV